MHRTVNHSETYLCPITEACTNTLEGFHGVLKMRHKRQNWFVQRTSAPVYAESRLDLSLFLVNVNIIFGKSVCPDVSFGDVV